MPVSFAQIANNTATVTFQIELHDEEDPDEHATRTESVTVVYYPGRVTEKAIAQMQSFGNLKAETVIESLEAFNVTLASLMKSWDVYEDEEETRMFPIDPKRLAEFPLTFRVQVISAIMSDIRPEAIAPQTSTLS